MTVPARLIEALAQRTYVGMADRVELNLPTSPTPVPLRARQREALNLALSNSPIAAIAGTPGSGKTQVARAALTTAIHHQRSTLVVAGRPGSLEAYGELPLPPLRITADQDYRDTVRDWVTRQVRDPRLTLTPLHWLPDALFEQLTLTPHRHYWLELLESGQLEAVAAAVARTLPEIPPARQRLLVHRLQQAYPLLAQREHLHQHYRHLSSQALEEITDGLLATMTVPVLCGGGQLDALGDRVFDWVGIEDAHSLSAQQLRQIAARARKLVLLGELEDNHSCFTQWFHRLWPGYRVVLPENHRLHPDLAYPIFSAFYPSTSVPYTPPTRPYTALPETLPRLAWHHGVTHQHLAAILERGIQALPNYRHSVLTFCPEGAEKLRSQFLPARHLSTPDPSVEIQDITQWSGEARELLWIVCDATASHQPSLADVRWALTRATEAVALVGDKNHYRRSAFAPLFRSSLTQIRDLTL